MDDGFENPKFACLEVDYEEADGDPSGEALADTQQSLTIYELDLGLNHVVRKQSTPLDIIANRLIAVSCRFFVEQARWRPTLTPSIIEGSGRKRRPEWAACVLRRSHYIPRPYGFATHKCANPETNWICGAASCRCPCDAQAQEAHVLYDSNRVWRPFQIDP